MPAVIAHSFRQQHAGSAAKPTEAFRWEDDPAEDVAFAAAMEFTGSGADRINMVVDRSGPTPVLRWEDTNADLVEDFEDGTLQFTVNPGGAAPWFRTNAPTSDGRPTAKTGQWSFRAGGITHGQTSDAVVTVPPGALTVQCQRRVSSEPGFDFLRILINGVEVGAVSGLGEWAQSTSYNVSAASTITFRYTKNSSASQYDDTAYIDDVRFVGAGSPNAYSTEIGTAGVVWHRAPWNSPSGTTSVAPGPLSEGYWECDQYGRPFDLNDLLA